MQTQTSAEDLYDFIKTLALAIIHDVPKLAGRKNIQGNNGDAYLL